MVEEATRRPESYQGNTEPLSWAEAPHKWLQLGARFVMNKRRQTHMIPLSILERNWGEVRRKWQTSRDEETKAESPLLLIYNPALFFYGKTHTRHYWKCFINCLIHIFSIIRSTILSRFPICSHVSSYLNDMWRHSNDCNRQRWPQQSPQSIQKSSEGCAVSRVVMAAQVIAPQSRAKRVKTNAQDVTWLWLGQRKKSGG